VIPRFVSLLILLTAVVAAGEPAPAPPAAACRLDLHTLVLEPAPSGRIHVTAFFGLRLLQPETPARLFIPVDAGARNIALQALSRAEFDARHVHRPDLEGAFYSWSRARRNAAWITRAAIGLTGGLPAWLYLLPNWPRHGPAETAVVPIAATERGLSRSAPDSSAGGGFVITDARLLVGADALGALSPEHHPAASAALRRSNAAAALAVTLRPAPGGVPDVLRFATHGVRLSYETPLRHEAAGRRVLPVPCLPGVAPALTRIYARSPWHGRLDIELPPGARPTGPAQALVARVLSSYDGEMPLNEARRRAVNLSSVRALDGRRTTRLVGAFGSWAEDADILLDFVPVETLSPVRTGMGAGLLLAAWPALLAVYLLLIFLGARAYLWLLGAPSLALNRRAFLLLLALAPLATPWLMLRRLAPNPLPAPTPEDGALAVLSPRHYDALVRLLLWAILVCLNWLVILSVVRIALALRYG